MPEKNTGPNVPSPESQPRLYVDADLGRVATSSHVVVPAEGELNTVQGQAYELSEQAKSEVRRVSRQKNLLLRNYLSKNAYPADPMLQAQLYNPNAIIGNRADHPEGAATQAADRYFAALDEVDNFGTQAVGAEYAGAFLRNTDQQKLDLSDLELAGRIADRLFFAKTEELPDPLVRRNRSRLLDFQYSYRSALVHAVPINAMPGEYTVSLEDIYRQITGIKDGDIHPSIAQELEHYQGIIRDRLTIAEMVVDSGLWTGPDNQKSNVYARKPAAGELERLNEKAADTLERLHLLKAYGITPFEVTAQQMQLPWDIAVMPPLDEHDIEGASYAEGAIADFIFLPANVEREDILFHRENTKQGVMMSVGGSDAVMRFRLHDNGNVSYGRRYHNMPDNFAQQTFDDLYAGPAFQRLRGLFVALAFDAVVPGDIVNSRQNGGSTAMAMQESPKDPMSKRITKLLLQRSKTLHKAGVSETNRRPEGWEYPVQVGVRGTQVKLPEGARARPTAEEEARQYYAQRNIAFSGLPEGYTFRRPYSRGAEGKPITYRRASFRRTSQTAHFLKNQR